MPLWWGTGTPFLFSKAQIPCYADPHGIIHSTSLPPRGDGTICDHSSQPKLPHLKFGDSLHAWRRDSPSFHHRGIVLPMECLCEDTSNMVLFLCPAQLCDALHKALLTALSLSHHFLPTCSYDLPGLYRNGCPVSWKMQNSH